MGFNKHELMDFKKFTQSIKGLMYSEDTFFLNGSFKEIGSSKVIEEGFEAHKVFESAKPIDLELIYKTYLEWFNYTRNDDEKERIFVLVKPSPLTGENKNEN